MVHLNANYYKAVFYNDVLECIDTYVGTNLNQKYRTLEDLKKMLADTKEASFHYRKSKNKQALKNLVQGFIYAFLLSKSRS